MRDLTVEELGHVYGAGGEQCYSKQHVDNHHNKYSNDHKQYADRDDKDHKQYADRDDKGTRSYCG